MGAQNGPAAVTPTRDRLLAMLRAGVSRAEAARALPISRARVYQLADAMVEAALIAPFAEPFLYKRHLMVRMTIAGEATVRAAANRTGQSPAAFVRSAALREAGAILARKR